MSAETEKSHVNIETESKRSIYDEKLRVAFFVSFLRSHSQQMTSQRKESFNVKTFSHIYLCAVLDHPILINILINILIKWFDSKGKEKTTATSQPS